VYLTEEQISEITNMAELFFSIDEIAANAECNADELREEIQCKHGPGYNAYVSGWMRGEIPLRKAIATAAANGSNPAQQMMINLIHNASIDRL
jgi:hypothetical protein